METEIGPITPPALLPRDTATRLGMCAYYAMGCVIAFGVVHVLWASWKLGGLWVNEELLAVLLWLPVHVVFLVFSSIDATRGKAVSPRRTYFLAGMVSFVYSDLTIYALRILGGATVRTWP